MFQDRVIVGSLNDVIPPEYSDDTLYRPRDNVFFRHCGNQTMLIGLKYPCNLYFQGIIDVNVVVGKLLINGYCSPVTDSPLRLFSLKDRGAYSLSTTQDSTVPDEYLDNFRHCRSLCVMLEELLDLIEGVGCIVCTTSKLGQYTNWKLSFAQHQLDVFPNVKKVSGLSLFTKAETILNTVLDVESGSRISRKLKISGEWRDLAQKLYYLNSLRQEQDKLKVMVFGGKGVGKSSFLKYLINHFVNTTACLYIDLDIGQSEFTLCGCVSAVIVDSPLIGPNYSHLKKPLRSYFVGSANPFECLYEYLEAVMELLKFCYEDARTKDIPWFVNTMGLTKGLWRDVATSVISAVQPNHLVQMEGLKRQDNFDVQLIPSFFNGYEPRVPYKRFQNLHFSYHQMTFHGNSQPRSTTSSTTGSAKLREMVAVVYTSDILSNEDTDTKSKWIHTCTRENNLAASVQQLIFGDIVALCKFDPLTKLKLCFGFGVMCNITEDGAESTILSPIQSSEFTEVNKIVKSPIRFKGQVILNHFKNITGQISNFSTFDMSHLRENKEILAAWFGLD